MKLIIFICLSFCPLFAAAGTLPQYLTRGSDYQKLGGLIDHLRFSFMEQGSADPTADAMNALNSLGRKTRTDSTDFKVVGVEGSAEGSILHLDLEIKNKAGEVESTINIPMPYGIQRILRLKDDLNAYTLVAAVRTGQALDFFDLSNPEMRSSVGADQDMASVNISGTRFSVFRTHETDGNKMTTKIEILDQNSGERTFLPDLLSYGPTSVTSASDCVDLLSVFKRLFGR